jgi:hypothetical protein
MTSSNLAATAEAAVLTWTIVLATIIFSAGYLWHRLKEAFPELFRHKSKRYLDESDAQRENFDDPTF